MVTVAAVVRGARLILVVCLVVGVFAQPAGADPAADRARVAQERADAAAKLRSAEATDDELADAVDVLGAAERGALGKAQQATRALKQAEVDLAGAESQLNRQRRTVADRAVRAYTGQGRTSVLVGVSGVEDAARRVALAQVVQGRLVDAVDASHAAVGDLERRRSQQSAATKTAAKALRQVVEAKSRTVKAQVDLDRRIEGLIKEVDALDAEQAELTALLAVRASRAPIAPADPPNRPARDGNFASGPSQSGFVWPLLGRLTSSFGPRWGRMHQGQDIGAPTGTPIKAAKGGVVIKASGGGGYGNLTLIDHGGGFVTAYAHQSRFAVVDGDQVGAGQVIGYVGNTGNSTGPHLHFEVRVNGTQRNPRPYLP